MRRTGVIPGETGGNRGIAIGRDGGKSRDGADGGDGGGDGDYRGGEDGEGGNCDGEHGDHGGGMVEMMRQRRWWDPEPSHFPVNDGVLHVSVFNTWFQCW